MSVTQELTLIATALSLGMLALAVLCVLALMGVLHLGMRVVERREAERITKQYGHGRYGTDSEY